MGEFFVTMKDVCRQTGLSYETLRFYCDQGLVPNIKRDKNNYRVFDDRNVAWIQSLLCLRKCGMGIEEMKAYLTLCLEGEASIPQRRAMLEQQRRHLLLEMQVLQDSLAYIDKKQQYYDDVQAGKVPYRSNILPLPDQKMA